MFNESVLVGSIYVTTNNRNFKFMAKIGTLITYDVYEHHTAIKNALTKEGWSDTITDGNSVTCHLPNTTLWHNNKTSIQARSDFERIVGHANLERFMCYEFDSWAGFVGRSHKDD